MSLTYSHIATVHLSLTLTYSINLSLGYQLLIICPLIPLYFTLFFHRHSSIRYLTSWTLPSESFLPFCLVQEYSNLWGQGRDVTISNRKEERVIIKGTKITRGNKRRPNEGGEPADAKTRSKNERRGLKILGEERRKKRSRNRRYRQHVGKGEKREEKKEEKRRGEGEGPRIG